MSFNQFPWESDLTLQNQFCSYLKYTPPSRTYITQTTHLFPPPLIHGFSLGNSVKACWGVLLISSFHLCVDPFFFRFRKLSLLDSMKQMPNAFSIPSAWTDGTKRMLIKAISLSILFLIFVSLPQIYLSIDKCFQKIIIYKFNWSCGLHSW